MLATVIIKFNCLASPKCRPQYIASNSSLPGTALLPTYQILLEMRLSGYILKFPGGTKEPPNHLIFKLKERFEAHIILEETKQRAFTGKTRKHLECSYGTKHEPLRCVPIIACKVDAFTISPGVTVFKWLKEMSLGAWILIS